MLETILVSALATVGICNIWFTGTLFSGARNWLQAKQLPFLTYHMSCQMCLPVSVGFLMSALVLPASLGVLVSLLVIVPHTFAVAFAAYCALELLARLNFGDDSDDDAPGSGEEAST